MRELPPAYDDATFATRPALSVYVLEPCRRAYARLPCGRARRSSSSDAAADSRAGTLVPITPEGEVSVLSEPTRRSAPPPPPDDEHERSRKKADAAKAKAQADAEEARRINARIMARTSVAAVPEDVEVVVVDPTLVAPIDRRRLSLAERKAAAAREKQAEEARRINALIKGGKKARESGVAPPSAAERRRAERESAAVARAEASGSRASVSVFDTSTADARAKARARADARAKALMR